MKELVVLIVKYLKEQLSSHSLNPDSEEGVEVAVQCLENAYSITSEDVECCTLSLEDLYRTASYAAEASNVNAQNHEGRVATDEQQEEAEVLKLMGNRLMKDLHYADAIGYYSRAINLDPKNPVYFCNRAAGHIQMRNFLSAINDCHEALRLDPNYSKAYSRLGYAHQAVGNKTKARECYAKALEIEPDNDSYRSCLQNLSEPGPSTSQPGADFSGLLPGIDLSVFMKNPSFMQMASQMLEDPTMQNAVSRILSGQSSFPMGQVEELLNAGQHLADRLHSRMDTQQQPSSTSPADGASPGQQNGSPSGSENTLASMQPHSTSARPENARPENARPENAHPSARSVGTSMEIGAGEGVSSAVPPDQGSSDDEM